MSTLYTLSFLLAYHIAVRRGCDVDQPRDLAKSVTVERLVFAIYLFGWRWTDLYSSDDHTSTEI